MDAPILLGFAAGLVSFVSPCILPMISVYLTLITGMTMEELTERPGLVVRGAVVRNTAFFALGFTLVFTLAGGAAGWIGTLFEELGRSLEIGGGLLVIILGLSMVGLFQAAWLHKVGVPLRRPRLQSRGPLGSFGVGLFFAVACSHCIAPTLLSMLAVAGLTGSVSGGMMTMLAFSLGLTIPYLLTAVAITPVLEWLGGRRRLAKRLNAGTGALLAGFGLLMVTGQFTRLTEVASRLIPFRLPLGM
ncbi:MAG: cytochrome c biogenesis protein CcdA [Thermoleophilia bacterium]